MFDIGSGDSSRAVEWLRCDHVAHVFCFDPLKELCNNDAAANAKKKRLHVFNVAVSSKAHSDDATATLYCLNDLSSCSLLPLTSNRSNVKRWQYPPGKLYFKTVEAREVPIIRMDKFMADRRISRVLFVRIEAQGNALDVLASFGKRISDVLEFAIKVHTTDFPIYDGQTTKVELIDFMRAKGFFIYAEPMQMSKEQEEVIYFLNKRFAQTPRGGSRFKHLDYNVNVDP